MVQGLFLSSPKGLQGNKDCPTLLLPETVEKHRVLQSSKNQKYFVGFDQSADEILALTNKRQLDEVANNPDE